MSFAFENDKGRKDLTRAYLTNGAIFTPEEGGIGEPNMSFSTSHTLIAGYTNESVCVNFILDASYFISKSVTFMTMFPKFRPLVSSCFDITDWNDRSKVVGRAVVYENGNMTFYFPTVPTIRELWINGSWVRKNG